MVSIEKFWFGMRFPEAGRRGFAWGGNFERMIGEMSIWAEMSKEDRKG
jgi:hypothetical protein